MRFGRLLTTAAIFALAAGALGTNIGRASREVDILPPADIRRPVAPLGPQAARPVEVPPGVYWASWLPEGFVFAGDHGRTVNYWHKEAREITFGDQYSYETDPSGERYLQAREELWERGVENSARGPRVIVITGPAVDRDHVRAITIEDGTPFEDVSVRGRPSMLEIRPCSGPGPEGSYPWELWQRADKAPSGYPWMCPWSDRVKERVLSWNETSEVTIELSVVGVGREDLFRIAEGLVS